MFREQSRRIEAEPSGRAGGEILNEHVGSFDQTREDFRGARVLDIQRQALLGAVQPHEVRRLALDRLVVIARKVADAGTLDLDHPRTEIGKLACRERRRDRLLERDDSDAIKRSGHDES